MAFKTKAAVLLAVVPLALAGCNQQPAGSMSGAAGGSGMWVVHQVCDLVELRTGPLGTTVRLHLRRAG